MEKDDSSKPNFRQAGKQQPGKLVRGFIQDSATKGTTASIPYKFETILYKNTNPKGFGASAQRVSRNEDIAPGPGSYDCKNINSRENSTSYSKKGFGNGFVSKAAKGWNRTYINTGPGPGSYNPAEHPFTVTHIPRDNRTSSRDDLLKSSSLQTENPGPGYYNPERSKTSTVINPKIINSVFKSNTNRYMHSNSANPPPGSYEIDRSLIAKKPFTHFLGTASFMPPSYKKKSQEVETKELVNDLLGKEEPFPKSVPGPGHYFKANKDDEIVLFNQKIQDKNSSNFMAGNVTRFGEVIQKKVKRQDNPGPGTYIKVAPHLEEKTLVSGAVFMSETARRPFNDMRNFVGPTKYNPELLPKKSYHLNINKMWV